MNNPRFEHLPDKERRFVLALELDGEEMARLLQALGDANEIKLQDEIKMRLIEITGNRRRTN